MLLFEILQPGAGGLNRPLLFLVGGNIPLEPVESLNLLPQPGKFRLGLGEGAAKPSAHAGV